MRRRGGVLLSSQSSTIQLFGEDWAHLTAFAAITSSMQHFSSRAEHRGGGGGVVRAARFTNKQGMKTRIYSLDCCVYYMENEVCKI